MSIWRNAVRISPSGWTFGWLAAARGFRLSGLISMAAAVLTILALASVEVESQSIIDYVHVVYAAAAVLVLLGFVAAVLSYLTSDRLTVVSKASVFRVIVTLLRLRWVHLFAAINVTVLAVMILLKFVTGVASEIAAMFVLALAIWADVHESSLRRNVSGQLGMHPRFPQPGGYDARNFSPIFRSEFGSNWADPGAVSHPVTAHQFYIAARHYAIMRYRLGRGMVTVTASAMMTSIVWSFRDQGDPLRIVVPVLLGGLLLIGWSVEKSATKFENLSVDYRDVFDRLWRGTRETID